MEIKVLLAVVISAIFINNFVLMRFLGLCPYMGVSKQIDAAFGMGMAVTFVMSIASMVTWLIYTYLLSPSTSSIFYIIFATPVEAIPDLTFLRTIAFILVIASLVQFIEMYIRKVSPTLYQSLGIYLPLITTNCAILGVAVLNIDMFFVDNVPLEGSFILSLVQGISAGIGFTLVLVLMAGIRERLEVADVPTPFRGLPIAFITAALMAIAFLGFAGMKI
jgi:electron transport complex protein RnfA